MHPPTTPNPAFAGDDDSERQPEPLTSTSADIEMSWRLWVGIVAVAMGSSFQFGYGTGVLNNSYRNIRADFKDEHSPITRMHWSIIVSMYGFGGRKSYKYQTHVSGGLSVLHYRTDRCGTGIRDPSEAYGQAHYPNVEQRIRVYLLR